MHALVNSYGVWKKTFPSFGCRISLLKYFPTLSPVWDLVLVFIEHSPQGSLSQLLLKTSTFTRTKQDESQPLLGPPCKAWSLLEIIAHKLLARSRAMLCCIPSPHSSYLTPTQPVYSGWEHKASLRGSLRSSSEMNDSTDLLVGHRHSSEEKVNISPYLWRLRIMPWASLSWDQQHLYTHSTVSWPGMNNTILTHPKVTES